MKPALREISLLLWTSLAAMAAGCSRNNLPPEMIQARPPAAAYTAAPPTTTPPVPLAGPIDGLDEAVLAGLFF